MSMVITWFHCTENKPTEGIFAYFTWLLFSSDLTFKNYSKITDLQDEQNKLKEKEF